jgi:2-methylcitrate dehydratase PrpD
MGATEAVAMFVAETDYEDIPEAAIANAKMAILDCLGTALAGSAEPVGKLISEYVRVADAKLQRSKAKERVTPFSCPRKDFQGRVPGEGDG